MAQANDAVIRNLTDAQVLDTEGRAVPLSSLWRDRTVVLAFVRHFG